MKGENEKYSNKDFTGCDLSDRDDMSDILISNSCFSNETPDAVIFPKDMTGTTFIDCNLDNISIPDGNTVKNCSIRRFKCQNDLEDWVIDPIDEKPVEPVSKKTFEQLGISIDPKDIPIEKLDKPITVQKREDIDKSGGVH